MLRISQCGAFIQRLTCGEAIEQTVKSRVISVGCRQDGVGETPRRGHISHLAGEVFAATNFNGWRR